MKKKLLLGAIIMSSSMNAASLKTTFIKADRCNTQTKNIIKAVATVFFCAYIEAKIQRFADHLLADFLSQPDKN